MNVLVVAPHPDDETIGCGGTICGHRRRGDAVEVVFLTSGEKGVPEPDPVLASRQREAEALQAAAVLDVTGVTFLRQADAWLEWRRPAAVEALAPVLAQFRSERVYVPHPGEVHPDHRVSLAITREALARTGLTPEMLCYEVWSPLPEYHTVEDVSADMALKLEALAHYRSQLDAYDYVAAAEGLGRYRGALMGRCRYAEVFVYADLLWPGAGQVVSAP